MDNTIQPMGGSILAGDTLGEGAEASRSFRSLSIGEYPQCQI